MNEHGVVVVYICQMKELLAQKRNAIEFYFNNMKRGLLNKNNYIKHLQRLWYGS